MEQISIQVTPEVKQQAEAILQKLGISTSSAYEMFYKQIIANQGMPFEVNIPDKLFVTDDDPLLKLAGVFESDVTDISDRHDEYIGESLRKDDA